MGQEFGKAGNIRHEQCQVLDMKNLFQQSDWEAAAKPAGLAGFRPTGRVLSTHSRRGSPGLPPEQGLHL
jgi:hypothetical protein